MLWMIPQYAILTAGEIMYSVTGYEFSYSQAPTSMKTVIQSLWLFTTAVGNLIIVIIEAIDPFEEQVQYYLVFIDIYFKLNLKIYEILSL